MKTRPIVSVIVLAVVAATASGCAALSDGLSDAQSTVSLPAVSTALGQAGVSPSESLPVAEASPEPDTRAAEPELLVTAAATAPSAPEKETPAQDAPSAPEKETPAKEAPDEFYDPFAQKDDVVAGEESDPWEGFNSAIFEFNRKVDKYVIKPVAKVYDKIVPNALQKGIDNFSHNTRFGPRLINNLLQFKLKGTGIEISRFLINSTLGIGGLFDPAKNWFGLETPDEDTGQTLGAYGVPPGPYLVLPLLPPLTVRDFFGFILDFGADPINYFVFPSFEVDNWPSLIAHKNRDTTLIAQGGRRVEEIVNYRSLNLETFEGVEEATVDLYAAVRNAYLQKRAKAIRE